MDIKKKLSLSLLLLVIGILFSGCSTQTGDKVSVEGNVVKVESDENKVNTTVDNKVTVNPVVSKNQSGVEQTTDKELIKTDNVEIGELI